MGFGVLLSVMELSEAPSAKMFRGVASECYVTGEGVASECYDTVI